MFKDQSTIQNYIKVQIVISLASVKPYKLKFLCYICDQDFNKETERHMKRSHPSRKIKGSDEVPQSGTFHLESLHQEKLLFKRIGRKIHPGDFSFEEVDQEAERTHREKNPPVLPEICKPRTKQRDQVTVFYCQRTALEKNLQKIDEKTQTDEVLARKIHVKIIRGIIKFQKDCKMMEKFRGRQSMIDSLFTSEISKTLGCTLSVYISNSQSLTLLM